MSKTYMSAELRRRVIEDFAGRCAYCRSSEFLMDGVYQMDHILPESLQGPTVRDNLCFTCSLCNLHKSMQWKVIDPQTKQRVNIFHPRRQNWFRHFEWSEDGRTIRGRTRCGRATIVALKLNDTRLVRLRSFWLRLGSAPPNWELSDEFV